MNCLIKSVKCVIESVYKIFIKNVDCLKIRNIYDVYLDIACNDGKLI